MKPALGIEIGGTKIQVGLGTGEGVLTDCRRRQVSPERGAQGVRELVSGLVEEVLARCELEAGGLAGIGVGFGGPVDYASGRTLVSHQVDGWRDFPLRSWLAERYAAPVTLLNDADAAAWAEAARGAGRAAGRVLYVTVGSGIGGGWIVGGRLDVGQGLGAAEIGHTWVCDPGTGGPVQLEEIASGWAIAARAERARALAAQAAGSASGKDDSRSESTDAAAVYADAQSGDPLARTVLERAAEALGQGLANALALWHPQLIILGGGVSLMGTLFWEPLERAFRRYSFPPFREGCRLARAALGEQAVVIGAVLAALDASGGAPQ